MKHGKSKFGRTALSLLFLLTAWTHFAVASERSQLDENKVSKQKVEIQTYGERFTGVERISPNKAKSIGGTGMFTTVTWNTVFATHASGSRGYYVRIIYEGYGWLFLTGEVIILLNGSERVSLSGPDSGDHREVLMCGGPAGCKVQEGLRVPIDKSAVEKIAAAESIEIRIVGRSQHVEGYLKPYHQAGVRALLARVESLPTN